MTDHIDDLELIELVISTLKREFPLLASMELQADSALLSAGLLDSFALVMLVAILEEELKIEIDVEEVPLEQFESPSTIAQLCLNANATR